MDEEAQLKCKIAALSNPLSGKNKRGAFAKFNKAIANFPQVPHTAVSNPADIMSVLDKYEQDNIQLIILNGGDGTLQTVLTYLKQVRNDKYKPYIILLKAGTTSMAFGDVGCRGKLSQVLSRAVQYAAGDKHQLRETTRPVLRMHIPKTGQSICGLFFGAGAIYSGILYCRQKIHTKGLRGELGPSLAMIWFLLDWVTVNRLATPVQAELRVDEGEIISGDFNIIAATTLNRLLMGVYPFWAHSDKAQSQAFSLIRNHPPHPVKAFLNILRGRDPNVEPVADYYRSYHPVAVNLKLNNGFTFDGELFGAPGESSEIVLDTAGTVCFLTI